MDVVPRKKKRKKNSCEAMQNGTVSGTKQDFQGMAYSVTKIMMM